MKNNYEILEIREDASPEVIEMAYKALIRKYHPDVFQGDSETAHNLTQAINEAHRILSDPVLRQEYDDSLKPSAPPEEKKSFGKKSGSLLFPALCVLLLAVCIGLFVHSQSLAKEKDALEAQGEASERQLKEVQSQLKQQQSDYADLAAQELLLTEYLDAYYSRSCFTIKNNDDYHRYGCPLLSGKTLTVLDLKNAKRLGYRSCPECWDKTPEDFF